VCSDETPQWKKILSRSSYIRIPANDDIDYKVMRVWDLVLRNQTEFVKKLKLPHMVPQMKLPSAKTWAGILYHNDHYTNVALAIGYEKPTVMHSVMETYNNYSESYETSDITLHVPPHMFCYHFHDLSRPFSGPFIHTHLPLNGTGEDFFTGLRQYNMGVNGYVCFGSNYPKSFDEAVQLFWSSPFNTDGDFPRSEMIGFSPLTADELERHVKDERPDLCRSCTVFHHSDDRQVYPLMSEPHLNTLILFPENVKSVTVFKDYETRHTMFRTHTS